MIKYLVFLGMAVSFLGTLSYIKAMIKGTVRPNRVTWFVWAVAPLIAFAAALADGVGLAAIPVFTVGFFPLLVFTIAVFKKDAFWKLSKFDILCGILSIMALVVWYITKNPVTAIVLSLLSDFFASLPTLTKTWKYPETEDTFAYLAGAINAATSFAAIKVWNFSSLAFPIYIIVLCLTICIFIQRNRFSKHKKVS